MIKIDERFILVLMRVNLRKIINSKRGWLAEGEEVGEVVTGEI